MRHEYRVGVEWTGAGDVGTEGYRTYARDHVVRVDGLPDILGSADPTFRGDRTRHNPEQLLVAALVQCHMLSYLHQAVTRGVVVTAYVDVAEGFMTTSGTGGAFDRVLLRPRVTVRDADMAAVALEAHLQASKDCFIASSVAFPVEHAPTIWHDGVLVAGDAEGDTGAHA